MRKFKQRNLVAHIRKFSLESCFTALFMALCISACSDDDDAAKVVFPEKQTVNCVYGDTKELNFEVNANWQLTSSATWCRFMNDGHEDYSLSGTAGKQTVTLKITDEVVAFDAPTVAHLTMMIGADKAIIADVVRDNKTRELKIYDMEGNEIQEIEVGYDDYKPFQVKANFRFAATNRPEWLEVAGNAIVGTVNEMTKGEVKVIDNPLYAKYVQNGTLTFADEDGVMSYSFPLVYKGMDPKKIKILNSNPWNWEVSLDGKTFIQTSSAGASASTTTSTYNKFIPYTVQALNDEVVPVYIQKVVEYGMVQMKIGEEDGVDWIKLEDDKKGNLRLKVNDSSEEREGYVLLLPQALYDEIKDELWENLIEMDMETYEQDIKYTYQQNNLLINFVQKEKKQEVAQAFKVTYFDSSWNTQEAICTKVTDTDIINLYPDVSDIYTMEWPSAQGGVTIDPLEGDFELEWNFKVMRNGEDITSEKICEGSDTSLNAFIEGTLTEEFHILIEKDGEIKKVLIVTPNYN